MAAQIVELRDVHLSGKWLADTGQLVHALSDLVTTHQADRIRLTEVSPKKFRKALKRWAKAHHWFLYHPRGSGRNECAILSRYRITARAAFRATRLRLKFGRTAPTYVVAARTRGWGWADVLHTPAHNDGLRPGLWPTRVYRSAMEWLHTSRLNRTKRRTPSADYNLDVRLKKNEQTLQHAYPGLRLCAPKNQRPTEGNRVIDAHWTNLRFEPSVTLPGYPGFDHKPVLTILKKAA